MDPLDRSTWRAVWRNVGFVATAVSLIYCVYRAFDPPRLNWGDPNTDYNAMVAGRNFERHGFLSLRLTPHLLDRSVMTSGDSRMIYTHYPQLPDLLNGAMRALFGMTELVPFRLVALAFSFGSLAFVYGLSVTYWSRQTAQMALALWVTNPLWIQHADYLHHGPYGAFFGFGSLYFLARSFRSERRQANLLIAGVFLFLTYLSSYNYWILIPLLLAAATVHHYRGAVRPAARTLGILAAFAVAAIVFKVATNIWALDGVTPFLNDLRYQYLLRATNAVVLTDYRKGIWPILEGRVERFYTLALFPVAVFWALFPVLRRRWGGAIASLQGVTVNPLLLLLAAMPFALIFSQMLVDQYYPMLLLLPFHALGCAAIITLLRSGPKSMRMAGGALATALVANSVYETVSFKSAFFDETAIRSLRVQLDSFLPPGRSVLVSHGLDGAYRYYFDRDCYALMSVPPNAMRASITHFSDGSLPRFMGGSGAMLVQSKHLTDEMYDKNYFYVLARYRLWDALARPREHRRDIEGILGARDRAITSEVARVGEKVHETESYVLWRIPPVDSARVAAR
jgi:hypothetical protein